MGIYQQQVDMFRRRLLEEHLRLTGANRSHAAKNLGMQRTYLQRLIRRLNVDGPKPKVGGAADRIADPNGGPA